MYASMYVCRNTLIASSALLAHVTVYVCMYVGMYVCRNIFACYMYVCVACDHACKLNAMHGIHTYVHMYIHACVLMDLCTCIYTYMCIFIRMRVCIQIRISVCFKYVCVRSAEDVYVCMYVCI